MFEYGDWREMAGVAQARLRRSVTRAAVLRDTATAAGIGPVCCHPVRGTVARRRVASVSISRTAERNRARHHDIRADFANGGLIVTGSASADVHRELIIGACGTPQAAQRFTPIRFFVDDGGLTFIWT